MSEITQSFNVWKASTYISWQNEDKILGVPRKVLHWLGEDYNDRLLLFRIRNDILNHIRDLPAPYRNYPVLQVDVWVNEAVLDNFKNVYEADDNTDRELLERSPGFFASRWLTNQFSSFQLRELSGRKGPFPQIYVSLISSGDRFNPEEPEISYSWELQGSRKVPDLYLKMILPGTEQIIKPEYGEIKLLGAQLLRGVAGGLSSIPLVANEHAELAITWNVENVKLWIRHIGDHETWIISHTEEAKETKNQFSATSVSQAAWNSLEEGNRIVLGRSINKGGNSSIPMRGSMIFEVCK